MLTKLKYVVVSCLLVASADVFPSSQVITCPSSITCTPTACTVNAEGFSDWKVTAPSGGPFGTLIAYGANVIVYKNVSRTQAKCDYTGGKGGNIQVQFLQYQGPLNYMPQFPNQWSKYTGKTIDTYACNTASNCSMITE